jgi:hypothetical protein
MAKPLEWLGSGEMTAKDRPSAGMTYRDTSLLPGEDVDLRAEILRTLGEEWLYAENIWLGGRIPSELIGTPDEFQVRDVLRSIRFSGIS